MKPFKTADALKRTGRIGARRKPFVAISGYVGPIRAGMKDKRIGATFEPPNTLKPPSEDEYADPQALEEIFETAQRRVAAMRLEAATAAIAEAAGRALTGPEDAAWKAALSEGAEKLDAIARGLPYNDIADAADRLYTLARIADGVEAQAERALRLAIEIAEMIGLIVARGDMTTLTLPDDIVRRIDERFPDLTANG